MFGWLFKWFVGGKDGCEHDWYIFEKKRSWTNNGGDKNILVKAVCLKCGERIDDFERIKKAEEEAARIAKERYGLALKMWANGEQCPPKK